MTIRLPRWFVAIVLYMFVVLALLAARPALLFDSEGMPKQVGLGLKDGYSFLAPSTAFPLLAILSYFVAAWVYVVLI